MAGGQPQVASKWTAGALLVLAGSLWGVGCQEEAPAMRAVKGASNTINAVAGGAEAAVGIDIQEKAFKDALRQLGEVKLDPSNPMISATGVLTAASQLGSAGVPADAAQASLGRLAILRSTLRSTVSQWTTVNAVAESATYDPAPRLAELDKQLTAAKGELGVANERLAKLRADQDKMLAAARDKADQASKFEQESVRLKEDARKLSAEASQPVLARALEAKGKCDELKLAVARTEADATLIEPRKLEVTQKIQELDIGIKSVEVERSRIVKRGEDAAAIEKDAKSRAGEVAKSIDKLTKDIAEEREKSLQSSLDAVAAACRSAQSSAASAKGDGKNAASRILSARAKQRLGEVLLIKAAEASEYAAAMTELATTKPALPGASGYADAAKAAGEAAEAAKTEAKASLEGARADYKGLQVRPGTPDEATRLAVIKYLTKVGGLTPDDSEAAPGDGPEKGGDKGGDKGGEPAADSPEAGEVRAFLEGLKKATAGGDADALGKALYAEGATEADLKPLHSIIAAQVKLAAACQEKFGKSLSEGFQGAAPGGAGGMGGSPLDVDLAHATIEVAGDSATAKPEQGQTVKLKKVDGAWKVDLSAEFGTPETRAALGMMSEGMTKAFGELADEVKDGKYEKVEEVVQALMQKMMKGMMPKGAGDDAGKGTGGG